MLTLCLDTAYKYLTCTLIEDDHIVASHCKECFKRQSEEIFMVLNEMLKETNHQLLDIDSLCISKGPGSYTGVRIAMTIAKTIASLASLDLYTISTLRLYANMQKDAMVLLDARASRAYLGKYDEDKIILDDCIMEVDQINNESSIVIGDGSLIELEDFYFDIGECFLNTKSIWEKVEDIDHLVPSYLKESEAYFK